MSDSWNPVIQKGPNGVLISLLLGHDLFTKGETMGSASLLRLLIHRLGQNNVCIDHIPGLVRNVLQVISEGGLFTTHLINEQLEHLGWGPGVLDETSFQLIVYILESEWGYRVRRYREEESKAAVATDWRLRRSSTTLNSVN